MKNKENDDRNEYKLNEILIVISSYSFHLF